MPMDQWLAGCRRGIVRFPVVATVALWCAVRIVQWSSGAVYTDAFLDDGWQMVPREVLRSDVLRSVWYLHGQPPLYNFTIGLILRFSPFSDLRSTQALILASSLLAVIGLQRLGVLLGLSTGLAIVLAIVVTSDPYMIRYELDATYEIPMLALLVWTFIVVHRAVSAPSIGRYAVAAALLTAVVMTRSIFHPLWLAIVLLVVVLALPRVGRVAILTALAIPTFLVGGWMLKNEVVFGEAQLSSWLGMNLDRGVIAPMNADRVGAMVGSGDLPEIVTVPPFDFYESYVQFVDPCAPAHSFAGVSQPLRPNGFADYNYECFLPVYHAMFDASLSAVRHSPGDYLASRLDAMKFSSDHNEEAGYGHGVLDVVRPIYRVLFLDVRSDVDTTGWYHPLFGPGLVIVYPSLLVIAALAVCGAEVVRRLRRLRRREMSPDDLLVAVCAMTVVWVVATGTLLEMGENARFRAMIHPVMILVAVAAAMRWWCPRAEVARTPLPQDGEDSTTASASTPSAPERATSASHRGRA
jgi:hypothetical protein